ncbi:hypothetical protein [Devosia sp. Root413D1]|nr:hypothetical protein [Devosia sp. Root413D1]
MFFPRKLGLRRYAQKPKQHLNPNDELRPELKLSKLELMALLLIR